MKAINSSKAPSAIGPYSQAVDKDGFIFVSGQTNKFLFFSKSKAIPSPGIAFFSNYKNI